MKHRVPRPCDRARALEQRRKLKMAGSAHCYVRGTPAHFYEWLRSEAASYLPKGPPIWICGDCHVCNLGPTASDTDRIEIEIRDFDQTVIGNPAHDLVRLGLSLATSARAADLPGVITAEMMEGIIKGYVRGLRHPNERPRKEAKKLGPVEKVLKQSIRRKWHQLATERIDGESPNIPLGECFWSLSRDEKKQIDELFKTKEVHNLVTRQQQRDSDDDIKVADAAYWVKGCSSLGRLRYAVLVKIGQKKKGTEGFCLIDIKEAAPSEAPHADGVSMPQDCGKRVVKGACALSPYLGERMLTAHLCGRPVVIRELRPADLRLELNKFESDQAVGVAHLLAEVVGRAHGRQMNVLTRNKWIKEVDRHASKGMKTPSWLWKSVVDLIAEHDSAYLEHCREYALRPTGKC